ncbi:transcriptional regulator [Acinetobacter baumannii]|uniref:lambdoid prophage e14 transcriptional regulatory protein n=1 Tax=Acinetobacter calcoaceticus/baumannii complex TaxID=909768 RepID=UPI00026E19ED|nr:MULTISPECIES: lambdoid prophage e14 transcriptional regulatory protein [Acinetobacter calcoaceticus/baumannii complex]HAV4234729.1 transcriptional regulator [Acinetobacter baumannii ATCC 17978]EHU1663801.1 transcriptional regulator [Acinetobacter baumannii]EHU1782644.1 transcriptional regulator [Acinetobacter baumannii]EHU1856193.1 transcriptional regulator [Acinetobacter baumannii]EHU1954778.1 transcriptional regulator [Acinetobacter baumannii]
MEVEVSTKSLADYLNSLPNKEAKEKFAKKCGSTLGYLRLVVNKFRFCSATLAIALDRESHGKVSCDELCPNADFEYVRRSTKPKRTA